ncbi:MAG: hypothetical protein AAF539_14465 [Planctomycetota bacterium]
MTSPDPHPQTTSPINAPNRQTGPEHQASPDHQAGPDIEAPLASRIRTWIDILPVMRLLRVCRVAGSPIWITNTLMVLLVWMGLESLIAALMSSGGAGTPVSVSRSLIVSLPADWILELFHWRSASSIANPSPITPQLASAATKLSSTHVLILTVLTLTLWVPTWMTLARVGGLLVAGRDMPSWTATWRWTNGRLWRGYVLTILPAVCCLPMLVVLRVVGWSSLLLGESIWYWATLPLTLSCLIVVGLILAAAKTAVPLGWAALAMEADPDPMDALSRGYEMTLRRLPQLVGMGVIAIVVIGLMTAAWWLVAVSASQVVVFPVDGGVLNDRFERDATWESAALITQSLLMLVPVSVGAMLAAAMTGGLYLLLRQSTGGQEVEDVAENPPPSQPRVPSVQTKVDQSESDKAD